MKEKTLDEKIKKDSLTALGDLIFGTIIFTILLIPIFLMRHL